MFGYLESLDLYMRQKMKIFIMVNSYMTYSEILQIFETNWLNYVHKITVYMYSYINFLLRIGCIHIHKSVQCVVLAMLWSKNRYSKKNVNKKNVNYRHLSIKVTRGKFVLWKNMYWSLLLVLISPIHLQCMITVGAFNLSCFCDLCITILLWYEIEYRIWHKLAL